MRYGIFSDIHSNLEALEKVLAAYKDENIDAYFCLGDIIGYATNPNECVKKVNELNCITIAGNHEWGSLDKLDLDYFNELAKIAIIWSKSKLTFDCKDYLESLPLIYKEKDFILVHGSLDYPERFYYIFDENDAEETLNLLETNICFVGHTHKPGFFTKDEGRISYSTNSKLKIEKSKKYIVNVGSVGQPRDRDSRASFCIYDTKKQDVEIKRIDYEVKKTYDKIIDTGLPIFLAQRLLTGK
ncbi:MAG: metallophosphoesterase family protein [Candidatus Omnitrophota bacterium]